MITSRQNGLIKRIRALRDKKQRDLSGEYVVEGVKSVRDAKERGAEILIIAATVKGAALIEGTAFPLEILSDDVFKSVSEEVSPQGVLAIVKKPVPQKIISGNAVFLDGVADPANVGAIIRSAAAFGYKNVLIADGADAYANKAVRASMGGIFRVNVYSGAKEDMLALIRLPIIVADMRGETLGTVSVPKEHCLCIGNEAHGVSEKLKALAAQKVSIPMENGMESLNAAVSAGIIMYALTFNK
ncbi:MAG: RNA methyltransferase [Clostridia bacterium]|nr:RNA methyltransferase [Clostridia bacterium]